MSSMTAPYCVKAAPTGGRCFNFALRRLEEELDWSDGRDLERSHGFGIYWIEQGAGRLQVDQSRFSFGPGSLIFISPGQLNGWTFETPVRGELALFAEEFLSLSSGGPGLLASMPFLYGSSNDPSLRLEGDNREAMGRLFTDLRREVEIAEIGQDDQVRARLTLILGQARRLYGRSGPGSGPAAPSPLSWRFRMALAQHFPHLCLAAQYAEMLNVSRVHLNRELRRQVGRTASELIHERTVLEAKRLLVHTALTISEIGFQLQFRDPSYFVRFFRRLTDVTPGHYRAGQNGGARGRLPPAKEAARFGASSKYPKLGPKVPDFGIERTARLAPPFSHAEEK